MEDIKGYEGLYAITSCGRVWSYRSKKFIKTWKSRNGYFQVSLYNHQEVKVFLVHRLVAQAYIPNPDSLPEVNHKDENKEHNWINNLEWCDRKYNMNYGKKNDWCKKQIKCIETGEIFNSIEEAAKSISRHRQGISDCCRGKQTTCGGFHWQYIGGDAE